MYPHPPGELPANQPTHPPTNQQPDRPQVEIGEEAGLEYSSDSEQELDAVSELGADFGVPPPLRFKLLHNLWSAGVPRARRVTIKRDG